MATKELPANCFRAAQLARENGIDPRFARARLRKAVKDLPPCVKGPHVHNESWIFENKFKQKVLKAMKPQGVTKQGKIDAEDEKAAKELTEE